MAAAARIRYARTGMGHHGMRAMNVRTFLLFGIVWGLGLLAQCLPAAAPWPDTSGGSDAPAPDTGGGDAPAPDAGPGDLGSADQADNASPPDGHPDAGPDARPDTPDFGGPDAGAPDTLPDALPDTPDFGGPDAGAPDALPDALPDTAPDAPDTGTPDGGPDAVPDLGEPEVPIVSPGCVRFVAAPGVGRGSRDGSSWDNAAPTLQAGIGAAADAMEAQGCARGQVWVAVGVYPIYVGRSDDAVRLVPRIDVYGGFTGHEAELRDRDVVANPTVLDGAAEEGLDTRVWHVVIGADDARLDGFLVRNGRAEAAVVPDNLGGGMLNVGVSPTVANCIFEGNEAADHGAAMANIGAAAAPVIENCAFLQNGPTNDGANGGGAVLNADGAQPTFRQCRFAGNAVSYTLNEGEGGGAVACRGRGTNPLFEDCLFSGNEVRGWTPGGAVCFDASARARFRRCQFIGNLAGQTAGGGAVAVRGDIDDNPPQLGPTFEECVFADNRTQGDGEGGGGLLIDVRSVTLTRCVFALNDGNEGGGLRARAATVTVDDSVFAGNCAERWAGGAVAALPLSDDRPGDPSTLTVRNSVFAGNCTPTAEGMVERRGAAASLKRSHGEFRQCTFFGNFFPGATASNGGALSLTGDILNTASAEVYNSILWNDGGTREIELDIVGTSVTVEASTVRGGHTGSGNLSTDPRFVDLGQGRPLSAAVAAVSYDQRSGQTILTTGVAVFGLIAGADPRQLFIGSEVLSQRLLPVASVRRSGTETLLAVWGDLTGKVPVGTRFALHSLALADNSPASGSAFPAHATPTDLMGTPRCAAAPDRGAFENNSDCEP